MNRFGQNPWDFCDTVYQDTPPWDIGGPQPALMDLLRAYPPAGASVSRRNADGR